MDAGLRRIIADIFEVGTAEVDPGMTPESVELWDSLNHLRLITSVEEHFGIRFSMSDIQGIESIRHLSDLLKKHRGEG